MIRGRHPPSMGWFPGLRRWWVACDKALQCVSRSLLLQAEVLCLKSQDTKISGPEPSGGRLRTDIGGSRRQVRIRYAGIQPQIEIQGEDDWRIQGGGASVRMKFGLTPAGGDSDKVTSGLLVPQAQCSALSAQYPVFA